MWRVPSRMCVCVCAHREWERFGCRERDRESERKSITFFSLWSRRPKHHTRTNTSTKYGAAMWKKWHAWTIHCYHTHSHVHTHFFYVPRRDRSVIIIHIMTIKISLILLLMSSLANWPSSINDTGSKAQMKNPFVLHKILFFRFRFSFTAKTFNFKKIQNEKFETGSHSLGLLAWHMKRNKTKNSKDKNEFHNWMKNEQATSDNGEASRYRNVALIQKCWMCWKLFH